jgi:large subunit ribosomal protein L3
VFPGKRMSGHMGVVRRTIENLRIVGVDAPRNLLLIRGAVPGAEGGKVIVRASLKAARLAKRKVVVPIKAAVAPKAAAPSPKPAAPKAAAAKTPNKK